MQYAQDIVSFLSVLTVLGQVIAVLVAILLVRDVATGGASRVMGWISAHGVSLMLVVATMATIGSLYFSEIAQWTPCKWCWFQRIFMYPQVALLIVALYKRDRSIAPYILLLSVIGIGFAAMHYTEQVLAVLAPPVDPNVPCDTSGVSCARTPFFHFGYITIPMMALTAFVLNALGAVTIMRRRA